MEGWTLPLLWSGAAIVIAMLARLEAIVAWTDLHAGLASWVQAVGSVVAIIAAAIIAGWQSRRSERAVTERVRLERAEKFMTVRSILIHVDACFEIANNEFDKKSPPRVWKKLSIEVAQARTVLASIPVLELPGPFTATRLGLVDQRLRSLDEFCNTATEDDARFTVLGVAEIFRKWRRQSNETLAWFYGQLEANITSEELKEMIRIESLSHEPDWT